MVILAIFYLQKLPPAAQDEI